MALTQRVWTKLYNEAIKREVESKQVVKQNVGIGGSKSQSQIIS